MGRGLTVGTGVAAGVALLIAGVTSAGLLGLRGGEPAPQVTFSSVSPTPGARPRPAGPAPALDADRVLARVEVDPAALPVRGVDSAAVVVVVQDDAVGIHHIALDATTGEWVRLDPATITGSVLDVSPDGRWAALRAYDATAGVSDQVVELATGTVRAATSVVPPDQDPSDCYTWPAAWAPGGGRSAAVTQCRHLPSDPRQAAYQETWLHEIDLATGATRLLEYLPGVSTSAPGASYSPDGKLLAYVVEVPDAAGQTLMVLRIVALDGSATRPLVAVHPVHGDPWLDAHTLVAWSATEDVDVLVDAATGTTTPLGVADTMEHRGTVGGRLVLGARGGPMACGAAACVVDPVAATSQPWLTLPGNGQVLVVMPARAVVQP